jgi:H2-forming N5,N10-methylenetetrahydromethanopterin dehydrogenase-like enzyme
MANLKDVKPKVVKVTLLDGIERRVQFTLNALAEMEDRYGSVDAAFKELDKDSIKAVRFILWAALMEHSPDLTEKQVGSLIDIQYLAELKETMGAAAISDLPDPQIVEQDTKNIDPN